MTPSIGYSNSRINSIDSSGNRQDEFGKWLHSSNFRAIKAAANVQDIENQNRKTFANLMTSVRVQDNAKPASGDVVLRPVQRLNLTDIIV